MRSSIADFIAQWAQTDRVAFIFEGRSVRYSDLHAQIEQTARGLVSLGVESGDRVGFIGLNRVEVFETFFAAAKIGAIFLPFNNRLAADDLAAQLRDADPTVVLCTDGFHSLIAEADHEQPLVDLDQSGFGNITLEVAPFQAERHTTVLMVYTSGTTGVAKGAMLSHDAIVHTALNGIDHQQLTDQDVILALLPTFHVGGLNIQVMPTLQVGGQVVLQRRFDSGEALRLIAEHNVTQTILVPATLSAVASHADFDQTDLSSLRGINSGSSTVPVDLMRPFFDRGVPIGQVYGTTETGPTSVVLDYDDAIERAGSCGRPATHTEVRIVNRSLQDVTDGVAGELLLRGPNVFTGYWRDAEATDRAFAPGGWFRTGDVGYRDPEGFIHIADRIKDVIISGGENIYPAEVEPVLARHPAVAEVALIGEPDDQWGEVPVAVVVLEEGATLVVDELREFCEGKLGRFKHPKAVRQVDSLPRTALGKVKKHELRRPAGT